VCSVTASADVFYHTDFDTGNVYIFGLGLDGGFNDSPERASERNLEFAGTDAFDIFNKSVTTTVTFSVSPGDHIFRFNARKADATNPNVTVDDASMSVVCMPGAL
jgi:hypothetical protein